MNNITAHYIWFISIASAWGGFIFGYDVIVMSGTIPQIIGQFNFSPLQLGIFVSCVLWGCAAGSGVGGYLLDALGRRKVLILSSGIMLISSVGSGFAAGPVSLILLRFLGGVGCGMVTLSSPLVISELAPEQKRGRLVSLYHFCVCLGIVAAVFVNWGIHSYSLRTFQNTSLSPLWRWFAVDQYWRAMFFAEALPGLLFFIASFIIPESPRWLMKRGETEKARSIISRINGDDQMPGISHTIENALMDEKDIRFRDFFTSGLTRSLVIGTGICILSEACGISAVLYYGPQMFEQAGLSLNDSLGGFIILAVINLLFNFISLTLMDKAGRKTLLLIGATGAMLSLVGIGSFYLMNIGGLFLLIPFMTFMAFFAFSVGPVKFVLISEFFPNKLRGKAASLATLCIWLTSAAVAYAFPLMRVRIHTGFVFYLFALDLLILILITVFFVPETRGKSMEEISRQWYNSENPS